MTITQQFRARECVARAIAVLGGHDSEVLDLLNEAYELLDKHEEYPQPVLTVTGDGYYTLRHKDGTIERKTIPLWLAQRGQP